jgi:hypothetical protein
LSHAVAFLDIEVLIAVVEQQHFDLTSVVCIDDTRTSVNEVL